MASLFSRLFNKKTGDMAPEPTPVTTFAESKPVSATAQEEAEYPEEQFSVVHAEIDGRSVIGSVNKGYVGYAKKAQYPWRLHIGIALDENNIGEDGLGGYEENTIAYKVEDELLDGIRKTGTAHFIGHMFNDGYLDVYVYIADPEAVHQYLQQQTNREDLLRGFGYEIGKDPTWNEVAGFL